MLIDSAAVLSQRARIAIVGTCGTLAAFFMFGGLGALVGSGGPADPESAVPRSSFLVATANLAELRRSPIHAVLFSDRPETALLDRKALGLAKLGQACGFDPLARVESLAVAVPEEGEKGDLGVAAKVDVTERELEACTNSLAAERGPREGRPPSEPKSQNGFGVIEAGGAKLAYGHGGLLVAGKGAWLDAMLQTADRKQESYRLAEAHTAIRRYLGTLDGFGAPTVVVSALLPRSLRDRIRSEMAGEAAGDPAQATMAGVLGVSGVGAAMKAGASGSSITLAGVFVCDSEDACASVERLVSKKRFEWSKELMLRMVGLGPLLDSIVVKRDGARLTVTASAPADQLASVIDRVLRLRAQRREREREPGRDLAPPLGAPRQLKPDEQIPAKP